MGNTILELKNIVKTFPGVLAVNSGELGFFRKYP